MRCGGLCLARLTAVFLVLRKGDRGDGLRGRVVLSAYVGYCVDFFDLLSTVFDLYKLLFVCK